MAEYLFVYGTLKREQPHHALLFDCRFVGTVRMGGALYALPQGFPAAAEGPGYVEGELYELPTYAEFMLTELDEYEDVPGGLFERRKVPVGGREAWAYLAGPALRPTLDRLTPLPGGRWPG